jgi:hypothetical protein
MAHLLARILKNQHKSINSIIYFTANLDVNVPVAALQETKNFFWIDAVLDDREPAPKELRDRLQSAWMQHFSTLYPNQLIHEFLIPYDRSLIEKIKFN